LILKDTGESGNMAFTKHNGSAKKFATEEEALFWAYGDRKRRGDTCTVGYKDGCRTLERGVGQNAAITRYLNQECTSLLENGRLFREKYHAENFNKC
jgi:hypothetical protein